MSLPPLPAPTADVYGDLRIYRQRTVALLRRYFRMAMETGRLPSLLGREFFRTRITSYHVQTFEDAVIFVHDVERCLERLSERSRQVLARIVLQEYTEDEAAPLLGMTRRHVVRLYPEALDALSLVFLRVGMLRPAPQLPTATDQDAADSASGKKTVAAVSPCQEPKNVTFAATA